MPEPGQGRVRGDEHAALAVNRGGVQAAEADEPVGVVGDNTLGDIVYRTGRHTAPLQRGDTVFAATEILEKSDYPGRPDLGRVSTRLLGHKFVREERATGPDAPAGWKKVPIFEIEREIAVKRRSHYL